MNVSPTRADEVLRVMKKQDAQACFGEAVSQLEHALQAAWAQPGLAVPALEGYRALLTTPPETP
ncbi:MAG TPA: hypothetical protein VNY05_43270 [Candidatus Acidoferrales bacterium]|jgi:predicted HD phosphohydrolase|nr:hypothetical protein [Candidatus Acidoferrales bacterium]